MQRRQYDEEEDDDDDDVLMHMQSNVWIKVVAS